MFEERQIIDNRYEISEEIARGGFAYVYKGYDTRLKRPVAIKQLRKDFTENETALKMFLAEVDLTIKLEHPTIVRIYDTVKEKEDYFIIFEYVDGIDLKKLIIKTTDCKIRIPFNISAYVISEVCKALHYAHNLSDSATGVKLGIIHRDISPQNILLSYKGEVKLTDFGIAKARGIVKGDSSTRVGLVKGKLSYMSPEQAQGKPLDRTSDIYSLGIVMYELLTGKKLFNADTDHQLLQKVARGVDKQHIDKLDIPEPFKRILMKSLEPDSSKRFHSARDMKTEIDKFLANYEYPGDELGQFISAIFRKEPLEELEPTETVGAIETSEKSREPEKVPKGEERTLIDIIRVTAYSARKFAVTIGIALAIIVIGFIVLDTFQFRKTLVGKGIYNVIYPPIAEIRTIPDGAKVVIDDKPYPGVTPLTISQITPGHHAIKLILRGYETVEQALHITPRKKGEKVVYNYSFEVPIDITTRPAGAIVYIDGRMLPDTTPIYGYKLNVSDQDQKIRLESPGFIPASGYVNLLTGCGTSDRYFLVAKEEGSKIRFKIDVKFTAECKITVTPPDAKVEINGIEYPLTNGTVTPLLPFGDNELCVTKDNFSPHREVIRITQGGTKTVVVALKRQIIVYAKDRITGETITDANVQIGNTTLPANSPIQIGAGAKQMTVFAKYYQKQTITVDAGIENTRTVHLDRAKPQLKVRVVYEDETPVADAQIKLDGEVLGVTQSDGWLSASKELEQGAYTLEVRKWIEEKASVQTHSEPIEIKWQQDNTHIIKISK